MNKIDIIRLTDSRYFVKLKNEADKNLSSKRKRLKNEVLMMVNSFKYKIVKSE